MAEVCVESPRDSGPSTRSAGLPSEDPTRPRSWTPCARPGRPSSRWWRLRTAWWSGISAASVESEPPDEFRAVGPAPMAVLPARQRRGADTGLVESGIEERRRCGYDAIFVLGALNGYAVW